MVTMFRTQRRLGMVPFSKTVNNLLLLGREKSDVNVKMSKTFVVTTFHNQLALFMDPSVLSLRCDITSSKYTVSFDKDIVVIKLL